MTPEERAVILMEMIFENTDSLDDREFQTAIAAQIRAAGVMRPMNRATGAGWKENVPVYWCRDCSNYWAHVFGRVVILEEV